MMPNKTQARYNEAFRAISDFEPRFSPANWMSDFERAVLNTVSEVILANSIEESKNLTVYLWLSDL